MAPFSQFHLTLLLQALSALGQFGGDGYTPPVPKCKKFTCPKDQTPVRKKGYKVWSYGCKDTGMNFMSMGADFNPNDPLGSLKNSGPSFDKCCIENDACLQTCGTTSEECHNAYQKCAQKQCRGQKNCMFQGQMAQMMSQDLGAKDEEGDKDNFECRNYNRLQKASCECVPKDEYESATEQRLKTFYKLYNREKLDDKGEIKGLEDVKSKWKGKEPTMFLELTKKYKDKAVERRVKPKYEPPKDKDTLSSSFKESEPETVDEEAKAEAPEEDAVPKSEFDVKLTTLEDRKEKAKVDEDFDEAQKIKEEILALKADEVMRLKAEKDAAVAEEDYVKAKALKKRIAALENKQEL